MVNPYPFLQANTQLGMSNQMNTLGIRPSQQSAGGYPILRPEGRPRTSGVAQQTNAGAQPDSRFSGILEMLKQRGIQPSPDMLKRIYQWVSAAPQGQEMAFLMNGLRGMLSNSGG